MAKRRDVVFDPAVHAVVTDGQRREKMRQMSPAERRKYQKDKERSKVTYDMPPDLIDAVAEIARREGCSTSAAAAFLLTRAVQAYRRGEISFQDYKERWSRNPRFDWVLRIPPLNEGEEEEAPEKPVEEAQRDEVASEVHPTLAAILNSPRS